MTSRIDLHELQPNNTTTTSLATDRMTDNTQPTHLPHPQQPPEFNSPPPPFGEPPMTASMTQQPDQTATELPTEPAHSYKAPPPLPAEPAQAPAPAPVAAVAPPVEPSANPFNDAHQTTAAPAQLQEPPQHPERPPPTGPLTETPLYSEPAPILPPRPPAQAEPQTPPPPHASFDQMPDHPAVRQASLGRAQSPTQSVQRIPVALVAPQPVAPPPQAPVIDANAGGLESDPAIASLHAMFPDFDLLVLQSVLEATGGDKDLAVDSLLSMSDPSYAAAQQQEQQQPAQTQTTRGAPNQGQQRTQEELDEEFARQLMLEEEQQARGGAWTPNDNHSAQYGNVPYQQYQPRRSGEHQRPTAGGGGGGGGGIGEVAGDLQQQFRNFIGGAGGGSGRRGTGNQGQTQAQGQGQGGGGAGYQDQFSKFADTGKKTLNSLFSKVKQKMEEFDNKNPPDTQNMNQPPQSGHWSNWQAPDPVSQQPQSQQVPTYAQSPAPNQQQNYFPAPQSPPPGTQHGALNNNPYGAPASNANAELPTSSGRWQYQPEPASAPAPAQPQAPTSGFEAGTGTGEEPRRSVDTSRLGLLPKRPVSLMDVNANTRQAPPPARAPGTIDQRVRDSDEESLEYVDRPMPGSMARP